VLHCKLNEFQRLAERLKNLNTHDAFYLLKNCFSSPKLVYTLRSAPCYNSQIINHYDDSTRSILQAILTDDGWHQAKLPVKHGGLSLLSASDLALPAFLASVLRSAVLSQKTATIIIDALDGTNDVNYKYYMNIYMAVDHQETNTRFVDRCQSESMESSPTGYRR